MPGKVMILVGPSGCGKSTFADDVKSKGLDTVVVSADHAFLDRVTGDYKFDPTRLGEAHSACLHKFIRCVHDQPECTIVVDNTNLRPWEWCNYALIAKNAGFEIEFHLWFPNTIQEVLICASRNKHGVPLPKVTEMCIALHQQTHQFHVFSEHVVKHEIQGWAF